MKEFIKDVTDRIGDRGGDHVDHQADYRQGKLYGVYFV